MNGAVNMEQVKQYDILRIKGDCSNVENDIVTIEYPFTIFIDDEEIITLLCTPKSLEELTLGFLYSEGFIDDVEAIGKIRVDEENGRAYVYLKYRKVLSERLQGKRTITSGCGKGTMFYNVLDSFKSKKIEKATSINIEDIANLMKAFNQKSDLFISTGGVHSCGLCNEKEILYFEEDIGRHNALDKILGRALLEKLDLSDKIIVTSGRISSEMLIKAAKRGIPAVVSRSAPTSLAIDIARELNILLIGFARGQKMNIYTDFPSLIF
jgi:FdhD protein